MVNLTLLFNDIVDIASRVKIGFGFRVPMMGTVDAGSGGKAGFFTR